MKRIKLTFKDKAQDALGALALIPVLAVIVVIYILLSAYVKG